MLVYHWKKTVQQTLNFNYRLIMVWVCCLSVDTLGFPGNNCCAS